MAAELTSSRPHHDILSCSVSELLGSCSRLAESNDCDRTVQSLSELLSQRLSGGIRIWVSSLSPPENNRKRTNSRALVPSLQHAYVAAKFSPRTLYAS